MGQKKEPERLNLNAAQVAGGALAAVTSAVVASRFGVGGTLIGAGLASVVSTTGTTLYSHVLRRTGSRARGVLEELPRHGQHGQGLAENERAAQELPPHDDEVHSTTTTAVATPPPPPPPARRSRRIPIWAVPVVGSVLVFAIALGAITGAEAMTGRPAASWVGGSAPRSGTSVGSLAGGESGPAPGATPAATRPPTPASTAQAEPTQQPEAKPSAPSTLPATGPSPEASASTSPPPQATPTPIPNNGRQTPAGGG